MPRTLDRGSLRDQALAIIRQGMVTGEFRPGEVYSATGMAAALGVSNSPVREAMLTLVDRGVMEALPNRGFRVKLMSEADLDEVYDLRLMLEVPAVARACALPDLASHQPRLSALAEVCRTALASAGMTEFLEADRNFHLGLLGLLGNGRLVEMVEQLRDQTRLFGLQALADSGRLADSAEEHFAILDAVLGGDAGLATELMTRHIAHTRGSWARSGTSSRSPT